MLNNFQILIHNGENLLEPIVQDSVEWETERKGVPGKLTFNVVKDTVLNFTEGNHVRMAVNGTNLFYGYVFTKKRNKDGIISVTAYDQLRYLKNKDHYYYKDLTAAGLIKDLASKFQLKTGEIEDTEYVLPTRSEDNATLFDIIQSALDLTLQYNKKLYVLYDDFGKLTLKNIENLKLDLLLDAETAENFDYTSSIDNNTFNRIKLFYNNKDKGVREPIIAPEGSKASDTMKQWGILQYCEAINEKTANPREKADALLERYNKKTRTLSVSNAFGDIRVRAGCGVNVQLDLGDITVNNRMLVEKVKHTFTVNQHLMNLNLRGGEFI